MYSCLQCVRRGVAGGYGVRGLRQINSCRKVPWQVNFLRWRHFASPSTSLIFLHLWVGEVIFSFCICKSGPCLFKFILMLKLLYRNFLKPHMYLIFSCLQLPVLEVRCLNIFQLDLTVYFFIVTAKPSEKRAIKLAHLRSVLNSKWVMSCPVPS